MYEKLVGSLAAIARNAGEAILAVYESSDFGVETKEDDSPLTKADKAAHEIIKSGLARQYPDVPVVSEEGAHIPYPERQQWPRFFLVDPLDGTKEFIKKNGEFTVNIALIARKFPALGVIYSPVKDTLYWGGNDFGAFKQVGNGRSEKIHVSSPEADTALRVLTSRSHPSEHLASYLESISVAHTVQAGSAYKFCLLAEGSADIYPRFNPTMEWDTAAGQAIVEGAGGSMVRLDGEPFTYNKDSLINPGFYAYGWDRLE